MAKDLYNLNTKEILQVLEMEGIGLSFPPSPTHAVCYRLEVLYSFLLHAYLQHKLLTRAKFSQG